MIKENIIQLSTPLTKEDLANLEIGDVLELTGTIYTARDAAHKRLFDLWKEGELEPGKALPWQESLNFTNQFIFYAGPCPAKPGHAVGSIAPTTSMRMDSYVEMCFELGMLGMIGKGDRSSFVPDLCKKYGGLYLLSIGGASALISRQVKKCDVVAWEDLGTESIKKLEVEKLRLIVGIDSRGKVFQEREVAKYKIN